jgi:hypothetical protein
MHTHTHSCSHSHSNQNGRAHTRQSLYSNEIGNKMHVTNARVVVEREHARDQGSNSGHEQSFQKQSAALIDGRQQAGPESL